MMDGEAKNEADGRPQIADWNDGILERWVTDMKRQKSMQNPEDRLKVGRQTSDNGNRRGVALIVVLGFLSIMIVMAVAFLTQARVERLVAGASLEGMRTRQMAQTAIAAAMQDYLNAQKTVSPTEAVHDIFLSGDGAVSLNFYLSGKTIGDDRLLVGRVEDWLLKEHLDATFASGGEDAVSNAEWIWVRQQPGARSRILGRYAYACFDMSGLLDANLLGAAYGDDVPAYGAAENRSNVRKMVYEALSQNKGGENQRKLNVHQRNWKGFDTPAALLHLTDGRVNDGDDNPANRWAGTDMAEGAGVDVSSLAAYSYSVLHREDGGGKSKLLCTAPSIKGDADFISLAGGSLANVIKAMEDYESGDVVPQGVDYPSTKNVPMFNEIGVQVGLAETPTGLDTNGLEVSTYEMIVRMKLEFWYPFPSKDNVLANVFTVDIPSIGGSKSSRGNADIWVQLAGNASGLIELQTGAASTAPASALSVKAKFNDNTPYYAENANADDEIVFTVPLISLNGDALPRNMGVFFRNVQLSNPLLLRTSGGSVDSTPSQAIDFSFRAEGELHNGEEHDLKSMAVEDPA